MAKRRRRKRKSALDYIALPRLPEIDLDPDTKKGIYIVLILAFGFISFLSLFDLAGTVGVYIKLGLQLLSGWGKWMIPIMFLAWGYLLYQEEKYEIRGSNYFGLILFFLSFHALLFFFLEHNLWEMSAKDGVGGGYAGLFLADTLYGFMGSIASFILLVCILIISLLLIFNTSLVGLFGKESFVARALYPFNFIFGKLFGFKRGDDEEDEDEGDDEEDEDEGDDEEDEDEGDDEEDEDEGDDEEDEDEGDDEEDEDEGDDEEEKQIPEFILKKIQDGDEEIWWKPTGIEIKLPLNLLNGKSGKPSSGNIKENKEIIEKTMKNFGIQVHMGNVSVGPTVTEYTFKPVEGIRLSRITNLSNDLALALARHPIRIVAPIPGKSLVGIEVPNESKATVSLKEVLSSSAFKDRNSNLLLALGKDVAGKSWLDDLTKMPHLLVAGATNSGKSVCLNSIIVSLMYQNNPDDLKFIMVDPKRVELPVYNETPYLLTPVITEVSKTINALKWCLNEMDRRFDILNKASKKNIQTYNMTAKVRMPYIIFIIDELADLMVVAPRDIEAGVIRLAQMARAVGIHLVLATQRPSVDIITGVIKANMPARIAFSVASGIDSRTILDSLGAEKLLGRGDMLYQSPEMSKPRRLQGAFVSDDEIKKIKKFIKSKSGNVEYIKSVTDRQKVKGIGGFGLDGSHDDDDELLLEAKELIINTGKASASFLQRKLSIGYARAARLLDILEEAGVVGPSNGAKPREILLSKEQFEVGMAMGVSGATLHDKHSSRPPENFLDEEEEEDNLPPIFHKDEEGEEEMDEEEDEQDEGEEEMDEEEDEQDDEDEPEEKEDLEKFFSR